MKKIKKYYFLSIILFFINSFLFSDENDGLLIVIDKVKNSVVIGYNVTLENTLISYKNLKIFIQDKNKKSRNNLSNLIHSLTKLGATSEDIINILTILHKAGSLTGKLVVM